MPPQNLAQLGKSAFAIRAKLDMTLGKGGARINKGQWMGPESGTSALGDAFRFASAKEASNNLIMSLRQVSKSGGFIDPSTGVPVTEVSGAWEIVEFGIVNLGVYDAETGNPVRGR